MYKTEKVDTPHTHYECIERILSNEVDTDENGGEEGGNDGEKKIESNLVKEDSSNNS